MVREVEVEGGTIVIDGCPETRKIGIYLNNTPSPDQAHFDSDQAIKFVKGILDVMKGVSGKKV